MFLLDLVSIFFHLAAFCSFGYVCLFRPLGALLRIFNILVCHTIVFVSPWSVAAPYLLRFLFFMYLAVLGAYGGMGIYGCGSCSCACCMTSVVVRRSFLRVALSLWRPPSQHTWFPHLGMCSGGNVGCMGSLHTCLSYLCFPVVCGRGRVVVFCAFFVFGLVFLLLFCCLLFFLTRTSRLAPMARTLLGGLEQAMFKFFVVAARLFLVFCVCPNFDDLAKQRRKGFGGFLRSEKTISLFIFVGCASFSWFFFSVKPVQTRVAIFGSLGVCIYVPASRHWLISYSPIHLT